MSLGRRRSARDSLRRQCTRFSWDAFTAARGLACSLHRRDDQPVVRNELGALVARRNARRASTAPISPARWIAAPPMTGPRPRAWLRRGDAQPAQRLQASSLRDVAEIDEAARWNCAATIKGERSDAICGATRPRRLCWFVDDRRRRSIRRRAGWCGWQQIGWPTRELALDAVLSATNRPKSNWRSPAVCRRSNIRPGTRRVPSSGRRARRETDPAGIIAAYGRPARSPRAPLCDDRAAAL